MANKEVTFIFNYKPMAIGMLIFIAICFAILAGTDIFMYLLIIGISSIVPAVLSKIYTYYRITLSDDSVKVKTWRLQEKILFHSNQIKSLNIHKSDGLVSCYFVITTEEGDTDYNFEISEYRLKNTNKEDSIKKMLFMFENMVTDKNNITKIEKDFIANTETGSAIRWFVWFGLLVFAVKLYVDMAILQGLHFDTMNFLPQTVGIILATSFVCFFNLYIRKKKSDFITALIVGVALGLVLSFATKSYFQWENENNIPNNVNYYPLILDDFDEQRKEQRWLVPEETRKVIPLDRLYLYEQELAGYKINTELEENNTYLVPIAIGKFDDTFILKDGFKKAKLQTN